jgi:hypothetical protein
LSEAARFGAPPHHFRDDFHDESSSVNCGVVCDVVRHLTLDTWRTFNILQSRMVIENIRHKALRRFVETGSSNGLPSGSVDRLRRMLVYIDAIGSCSGVTVAAELWCAPVDGRP